MFQVEAKDVMVLFPVREDLLGRNHACFSLTSLYKHPVTSSLQPLLTPLAKYVILFQISLQPATVLDR